VPALASRAVILVAVQVEIEPRGIGECDRIVSDVGVLVETLRVLFRRSHRNSAFGLLSFSLLERF